MPRADALARLLIRVLNGIALAVTASSSLAGGPVTTPQPAVGQPMPGLTPGELDDFMIGRAEFSVPFSTEQGLGPAFNEISCGACHTMPLGGAGTKTVERLGRWELGVYDPLEHLGGPLRQEFALDGACVEQIPPEANIVVTRITPGALGYGLIESILDADLQAYETSPPRPGISGRAHLMPAIEDEGMGPLRVGRFGWKSQLPTVLSFSADAALFEMGLTNRFFEDDVHPNGDTSPTCSDAVLDPELPQDQVTLLYMIDRVALFQRYLAPPPQTPRSGMAGEAIFDSIGCTSCHVAQFITAGTPPEATLRNRLIQPYSDFLLHDMGAAADGMPQGDAGANEMRTSTLWGLRTRTALWHDGSIANPDFAQRVLTAIELHGMVGSESHAAGIVGDMTTPGAWDLLSAADRASVVAFLGSLGRREFDADGDDDVDLDDFIGFSACFTGPGSFYTPDDACAVHDIDQDGDVDLDDFASFQLVYTGAPADCNSNATDDVVDVITGASNDVDGNGVPDECEPCISDVDGDSDVDFADSLQVLGAWGLCPGCPEDLDDDGEVGFADLLILLGEWGVCPPPITGACCLASGACLDDTHGACLAAGGTYHGDDSTCVGTPCAAATGACCASDGTCLMTTSPACVAAGGRFDGDGISCVEADCQPATGACCFADGTCAQDVEAACTTAGGTYGGDMTSCAGANCPLPTAACCFVDGSCQVLQSDDCLDGGGFFQGLGADCVAANCQPITGACCDPGGSCTIVTQPSCDAGGGSYLGDDTLCADCPEPSGACCLPFGGCATLTVPNCDANDGAYEGNGTDCASVVCVVPTGACCETDGTCTDDASPSSCFFSGGTFEGAGTSCATASCAPTGACCFPDGTCSVETAFACAAGSGAYQGDDVTCGGVACPIVGACCYFIGPCTYGTEADCTANNGFFQGAGIDCVTADCVNAGACCLPTGNCQFLLEGDCLDAGGVWQGELVTCSSTDCPDPGACCFPDESCTDSDATACAVAGGAFRGEGTTCAGVTCVANDFCAFPEPIACNVPIVVNTVDATPPQNDGGAGDPELPAGSPSCQWNGVPTDAHNTLWYSFVALDTSVEIRTCASAATADTVIALYANDCGNLVELACADDNCGDGGGSQYRSTTCYDGLVPGITYRVMIGNPGSWTGSNPGPATLEVNCPCP